MKKNLRQLNEPICLFGEGPAERRKRLKELLARWLKNNLVNINLNCNEHFFIFLFHFSLGENAITQKIAEEEERKQLQREQETTWYHEGKLSELIDFLWAIY